MLRAAVLAILVAIPVAKPAWADTAYVTSTTWLRGTPAADARVLDELQDGQRVERMECGAGWCRVMAGRTGGCVSEAALQAAPREALVRAPGDCFPAQHFTPAGPVALRICPATLLSAR